jgi:hypothetical protein
MSPYRALLSVMPWQTKDLPASMWHTLYVNSLKTTQSALSRYAVPL